MKVSLDGLMVLDAIARRGSFAGAAEELYRVPSAVTYMVQKLEQDLRVQLFDRSGHRAKLTAVGEDLLKNGRPLLRAAADLEQRVQLVAKGWEPEVCIAHDQLVAGRRLYGLVEAFYEQGTSTRLTVSAEVLGGAWQASWMRWIAACTAMHLSRLPNQRLENSLRLSSTYCLSGRAALPVSFWTSLVT